MINQQILCSCVYCKEIKSVKGIHTHVDRAHLKLTKYSSGYNGKYDILSGRHQDRIKDYYQSTSKCTNCNIDLDYNQRHNKFCSTSCSATYTNKRKDYSTFKTGPTTKIKELVQKHCAFCNEIFSTITKKQKFCSNKCSRNFRSHTQRKQRTSWKNYRVDCQFKFSLNDFPEEFDFKLIETCGWYKPTNRGNNLTGVSRDHMVSCRYGFDNNIPVENLSHPANCKLLQHGNNVSKGTKNSITYDDLLTRIKKWDEKYK
jgi:predicted nucleic acid-binding Zn ribbon protein